MGEMTGGIKGGMKILKSFVHKGFRGIKGGIGRLSIKLLKNAFLMFLPPYQNMPKMFPVWVLGFAASLVEERFIPS